MNTQSKFNKLPKQASPVIRHTVSTAATSGGGVEANGFFDILKGAAGGALNALG
ncbi:hypothetical protein SPB21_24985 [Leptothoe sp. ISB3NOV94-8A]|uniref:hypothetical protein n=1 Tax=Adonisia turfae TaxID=2950184 RepID=UPI0013D6426A|nr:hypothetical protein [Adonisia turfae]MDV3347802.1 hypothetical protein [Leptothoe sp. LEGE 181152]